jgi:asparagine synthetase B (glutamine-hydrolysing)
MEGKLRPLLLKSLKEKLNGSEHVAILYSGGFESFSCLCLCLELGIKPHLYTFYLDGVESHDIVKARSDARVFGVPFTEVRIPNLYEKLKKDVFFLIHALGTTRKTVIQCVHPLLYALPKIREKHVIIGLERGRPWGLNQKGTTAGYKGLEAFNEYRRFAIEEQKRNSIHYIVDMINRDHVCIRPYDDDDVNDWFMSKTYKELNSPHAKQPILDEFSEEVEMCNVKLKHASYQVESKLREFHDKLLEDPILNPDKQYKSVVGVYNNMRRLSTRQEPNLFNYAQI